MSKAQVTTKNKEPRIVKWDRPAAITQEEAEARLRQEGYSPYRWHDVSGSSYPRHRHEYDECLWILSGEVQLTIGEQVFHMQSGDRIYLPARLPHSSCVQAKNGVTYLVGQKQPETLQHTPS